MRRPPPSAVSLAAALLLGAVGCASTRARGAACTFTNPLARGADPSVERGDGAYYLAQSRGRAIWVYRARTLHELLAAGGRRDSARVWTAPDTGWNQASVWAPELRRLDGRWYVYYAAGRPGPRDAPYIHQRSGVLEAAGADPLGPWTDRGMLDTGGVWAIDLTVGRIGGALYAIWSGWERNTTVARTPQHLYIARMANPYTVAGARARISSPDASWERREDAAAGLDLEEGPELLVRGGRTFVVYSTRESWLPAYRLGELELRGADPMRAESWVKRGPVFQGANGVYGPGHNSFTTSADGRQDWLVYHAKGGTRPGWNDRVIRMQPFAWRADGTPDFGEPVASGVPLRCP